MYSFSPKVQKFGLLWIPGPILEHHNIGAFSACEDLVLATGQLILPQISKIDGALVDD